MKEIKISRRNYGFEVVLRDIDQKKAQIIGTAVRLDAIVDGSNSEKYGYIHFSKECVPDYVGKDGRKVKAPIRESVTLFTGDKLYFPFGENGLYVDI